MNAIILCGGLSTRLGEITKEIPKILLDVGGKSVLDWQLERLKAAGVDTVVLAAGHLAKVLYDTVGPERMGIELIYAIEDKRLGTGGAIKHALEYVKDPEAPTLVLNGDILYSIDFRFMIEQLDPETEGILFGARVEDASSYGTLIFDHKYQLQEFREKEGKAEPGVINGGLYLFTKHAYEHFPNEDSFSIEHDVFPHMKKLSVYVDGGPWIDVGVPERLQWAKDHWRETVSQV